MILSNLYEKVLMEPCGSGANELFIISGYASATFAHKHVKDLLNIDDNKKVNLIIGMPSKSADHQGFLNILKAYPRNFSGYYFQGSPNVHCKLYSWFKDDIDKFGFSGSANYSQSGFSERRQSNQMVDDNPIAIKDYYIDLLGISMPMRDFKPELSEIYTPQLADGSINVADIEWLIENKSVRISFLDRMGNLPAKSGLNWGQRVDNLGNKREPDQAYLSIRKDARKEGFLPEKGFTFTLLTDDGEALDCTVQQDGRKAISTTDNNSILGRYIRKRLGLKPGSFVTADDLERHGRTDFTLEKVNDETFYFDMSVV